MSSVDRPPTFLAHALGMPCFPERRLRSRGNSGTRRMREPHDKPHHGVCDRGVEFRFGGLDRSVLRDVVREVPHAINSIQFPSGSAT